MICTASIRFFYNRTSRGLSNIFFRCCEYFWKCLAVSLMFIIMNFN